MKAVDARGEMLESSWESHCTAAVNAANADELIAALETLISTAKINLSTPASVVYGHDTRPTCPALCKALASGLAAMGANIIDAGLKTTPQLHYLVKALNTKGTPDAYGEPTEEVSCNSRSSTAHRHSDIDPSPVYSHAGLLC